MRDVSTINHGLTIRCALIALLVSSWISSSSGAEIPAQAFFRDPFLSDVAISPDGRLLAALIVRTGKETMFVRAVGEGDLVPVARHEVPGWSIKELIWVSNRRLLFSLEAQPQYSAGLRRRITQLWSVENDGSHKRPLGPNWPVQEFPVNRSSVVAALPSEPDRALIQYLEEGGVSITPRVINASTGLLGKALASLPGVEQWHADSHGDVRAAVAGDRYASSYQLHARSDVGAELKLVNRFDPKREPGWFFAGFAEAPNRLYVIDHDLDGRDGLHEYDLEQGALGALVFEHPEVDVAGLAVDHLGRAVGVDYITDGWQRHYFDAAAAAEQRGLDSALPGATNRIVSASADGTRKLVRSEGPQAPPSYYLMDRKEMSLDLLFTVYPELDGASLSPMRAVSFAARDGLPLHGFVTTPLGRNKAPYPTIVVTLDRPQGRALLEFQPIVQFLASRGFAVLQVNFRGSRGYGAAFEAAGRGQWGLGMQDDIEDAVRWLVQQGIADPQRIGIFGTGFGGYTALAAALRSPELYRAVASYGAATDLVTLAADDQHHFGPWANDVDPASSAWSDPKKLVAISPYDRLDELDVPVLLGHGALDQAVDVKHAKRMHQGLLRAEKQTELLLYPNEGETLGLEANRVAFYEKLADFFERNVARASARRTSAPDQPE